MANELRIGEVPDTYPRTINKTPSASDEKSWDDKDDKPHYAQVDVEASSTKPNDDGSDVILHDEREIATHVISIDDDPSLSPWTFRSFFIGLGLSAFGGSLGIIIISLSRAPAHIYLQPKSTISSLCAKYVSSFISV
jgi:hypothetical protein